MSLVNWMLKYLVFSALVLLVFPASTLAMVHEWSISCGGPQSQYVHSIATDPAGNILITGSFYGTVDFGGGDLVCAGGSDVFVAKFDAAGNHLWSIGSGDGEYQNSRCVAADGAGNVIITGYFRGVLDFGGTPLVSSDSYDIFIAKFDADGNVIWNIRRGGQYGQYGHGVAVDEPGDVIVVGGFEGTVNFGGGVHTADGTTYAHQPEDVFIVKLDPNGGYLWSFDFGDNGSDTGSSLALDASGNIFMTGYFWNGLDFGGGALSSTGNEDIFLVKFDAAGNHLWSSAFGDSLSTFGRHYGRDIDVDGAGNVVITGTYEYGVDFGGGLITGEAGDNPYVAVFDPIGNHLWSRGFSSPSTDEAWGVAADFNGNVTITGSLYGTSGLDFGGGLISGDAGDHIYLAQFDLLGNHLWSQGFPHGTGMSVTAVGFGDIVATGRYGETVDFGGGVLTSEGNADIYLAKFSTPTIPVAVGAFESRWVENHVEISWVLNGTSDELSFAAYRTRVPEGTEVPIDGACLSRDGLKCTLVDPNTVPGVTYRYRVVLIGGAEIVSSFETEVTAPAGEFALRQNVPNPFNPVTQIGYQLGEESWVSLVVYDAGGRRVVVLVEGTVPAGAHTVEWNAEGLPSGVYFYRLTAGKNTFTKKMVLLK